MCHHIDVKATVMAHPSPRGGQHDVDHEGVATRGGALSLCIPPERKSVLDCIDFPLLTTILKQTIKKQLH